MKIKDLIKYLEDYQEIIFELTPNNINNEYNTQVWGSDLTKEQENLEIISFNSRDVYDVDCDYDNSFCSNYYMYSVVKIAYKEDRNDNTSI